MPVTVQWETETMTGALHGGDSIHGLVDTVIGRLDEQKGATEQSRE